MSTEVKSWADEFLDFYAQLEQDKDYWMIEKHHPRPMEEYELPENIGNVVMLKLRGASALASRNEKGEWIDADFGHILKKKPLGFRKAYRPDDPRITPNSE